MYILNILNKRFRLNTIKFLPYTQQSIRCLQFEPKTTDTVDRKTLRIRGEDSYRRMDGISSDYELIYRNQFHYTMNVGKLICLTTVPTSIGLQSYYYWTGTMPVTEYIQNFQISFNYAEDVPIMMGAFILMNLLVYSICHVMTLRIYKNDEKYIAIMPGFLPRINSKVHFKKGEVVFHPLAPKVFREVFKVSGRCMIIILDRYRKPVDFYEMLHESARRFMRN